MNISIDCSKLYFCLNTAEQMQTDFESLIKAMNSITVSSELRSYAFYEPAITALSNVNSDDIEDFIVRLQNIKRIMAEGDATAAALFSFFDQGILNGDFTFTDIPLLDQTDYDYVAYTYGGTVESDGCGLTSICMIATFFTGRIITPAELAALVDANTKTSDSNEYKMEVAAELCGLIFTKKQNNMDTGKAELEAGNIVVCYVKNSSHFLVLKGITEDGKVLVNDPYGPWAVDTPVSLSSLQFCGGNTWVFSQENNQLYEGPVDTNVTITDEMFASIQDESSYQERDYTEKDEYTSASIDLSIGGQNNIVKERPNYTLPEIFDTGDGTEEVPTDTSTVVASDVSTDGTTTVAGDVSADGTTIVAGDTSTNGTTTVAGDTSTNGTTTVAGDTSTNGTTTIAGDTSTNGTTAVAGDTSTTTTIPDESVSASTATIVAEDVSTSTTTSSTTSTNLEVTNSSYDGKVLSPSRGRSENGPQAEETWYDLNMDYVTERMDTEYGIPIETWIDQDTGLKMCKREGDDTAYVMVAADVHSTWSGNDQNPDATYSMGDVVLTSWGPGMVVDYCKDAVKSRLSGGNNRFDIGTAWSSGYYGAGEAAANAANSNN